MSESPLSASEVIEHYGTWLTGPDGYTDFVLRGPRPLLPGSPGALDVEGIILPFSSFLTGALQWSCDQRCEGLEGLISGAASERILVGTFAWAGRTYLASFIFFEDIPEPAFLEGERVSTGHVR